MYNPNQKILVYLESSFWLVAVPAVNRSVLRRFKGYLACFAALAACCVMHLAVSAFKSHLFTYFIFWIYIQFFYLDSLISKEKNSNFISRLCSKELVYLISIIKVLVFIPAYFGFSICNLSKTAFTINGHAIVASE